jgi:hypothetical protein
MTGSSDAGSEPPVGWSDSPDAHAATLDAYLKEHGEHFTPDALREAAIEAGYAAEEVDAAMSRQRTRQALEPIRSRARIIVLAAYGLVWLAFAVAFLANPNSYNYGQLLLLILTVAMVIILLPALLWVGRLRTDASRKGRALVILLVVPVVLLVGVAGLCLPFVGTV